MHAPRRGLLVGLTSILTGLAGVAGLVGLTGCPHHYQRSYAEPSVSDVIARLAARRAQVSSFKADSIMDYYVGSDRVKGTVKVMGTPGARVRFNAFNPADNVIADLACDGAGFVYVDHQHDCVLSGPCNRDSIAQLLHMPLNPDDFFFLALGQTPVLAEAAGTVVWDEDKAYERVELRGGGGTQSLVLDGTAQRWDVLKSELRGPDGKVVWSVTNKDFAVTRDANGTEVRLPGKTRFISPADQGDMLIDWKARTINGALPEAAFTLLPPEGLPRCGSRSP